MKKTITRLRSGTRIGPVLPGLPRGRFSAGTHFVHVDAIPALIGSIEEQRSYVPTPGSVGVSSEIALECPELIGDTLAAIDEGGPDHVTRHVDEIYLASTLGGYFRFGTIGQYKPKDTQLNVGRFSDFQEGAQRNSFESRDDYFNNFDFGNGGLQNIGFFGFEAPVLVEFQVNDYCSCSSNGEYNAGRANEIRANGNPTLGAYATYDLKKLRAALVEIISECASLAGHALIGRKVVYGEKDRRWTVESYFELQKHRDPIAIWMGTAFVKSTAYQHEDEFRLLLINPKAAGRLDESADFLVFNDPRIAAAITDVGTF